MARTLAGLTLPETRSLLRELAVVLLFSGLSAAFLWPVMQAPADRLIVQLPGQNTPQASDAFQYPWNAWHWQHTEATAADKFHTEYLFAPRGSSLVFHTYTPLLNLWCGFFSNAWLAINLFLLLQFLLSAWGAWRLARWFGLNAGWALWIAVVFTFSAYKSAQLAEHYNLVCTGGIPWFVLALLRGFRWEAGRWRPPVRSPRNIGAVAGWWLFTLGCSYYYAIFLLGLGLIIWFWWAISAWWGSERWLNVIKWTVPVILGVHLAVMGLQALNLPDKAGLWYSPSLINLAVPPGQLWWMPNAGISTAYTERVGPLESSIFLGVSFWVGVLAAAVLLWFTRFSSDTKATHAALPQMGCSSPKGLRKSMRVLYFLPFTMGIIFFILMYPRIEVLFGGNDIILPSALLHFIPGMNNLRVPSRYVVLLGLWLPLFLALMLSRRGNYLSRGNNSPILNDRLPRVLLPWALLVVALCSLWPGRYTTFHRKDIPPAMHYLAGLPRGNALFFPWGVLDGHQRAGVFSKTHLLYQAVHKKPLVGGYLSRVPASVWPFYRQDPFALAWWQRMEAEMQALAPAERATLIPWPGNPAARNFLKHFAIRYLVWQPATDTIPGHHWMHRLAQVAPHRRDTTLNGWRIVEISPRQSAE